MFVTYPRVHPFGSQRRPHPSGFGPGHRARASPRVTAQGAPASSPKSRMQFHHQYFNILSYSPGIATFSSIIKN